MDREERARTKKYKKGKDKKKGRPKKSSGTARKDNYRTKNSEEALEAACKAVQEKRMTAREAAKEYSVPRNLQYLNL